MDNFLLNFTVFGAWAPKKTYHVGRGQKPPKKNISRQPRAGPPKKKHITSAESRTRRDSVARQREIFLGVYFKDFSRVSAKKIPRGILKGFFARQREKFFRGYF